MGKTLIKVCLLTVTLSLLLGAGSVLGISAAEMPSSVQVPLIPERPTTSASQEDAYDALPAPGTSENNWYGKPYGLWNVGENPRYLLSDMSYLTSSNTPNDAYPNGQPTTVNCTYSDLETEFSFGSQSSSFKCSSGIGMHPKNPAQPVLDRRDSWTVYDISSYGADSFYALVGLTSASNAWGSKYESAGVYVYIYGDKAGDGAHYELLAESSLIRGDALGEFYVNVQGVKLLLIDVIMSENAAKHAYSAVGFGNACIYTADPSSQKPNYSGDILLHQHEYGSWQQYSATQHKSRCLSCQNTIFDTHTWDNGKITTTPTCTDTGVMTYTCLECDYWKVENLPSEHICQDWTSENEAQHRGSCACGQRTELLDHVYDGDSDTVCNDCGYDRTVATSEPTSGDKKQKSCSSSLALESGLSLLLAIGSAGSVLKKKED